MRRKKTLRTDSGQVGPGGDHGRGAAPTLRDQAQRYQHSHHSPRYVPTLKATLLLLLSAIVLLFLFFLFYCFTLLFYLMICKGKKD